MKAIFFIVIIWLHNGEFHTTVLNVPNCPPKSVVDEVYQRHLAEGKFQAWSALCTTVDFTRPKPKPDTKPKQPKPETPDEDSLRV